MCVTQSSLDCMVDCKSTIAVVWNAIAFLDRSEKLLSNFCALQDFLASVREKSVMIGEVAMHQVGRAVRLTAGLHSCQLTQCHVHTHVHTHVHVSYTV